MNPYENLYNALEKTAISNRVVSNALDKTIQRENIARKNLSTVTRSMNKHEEPRNPNKGILSRVLDRATDRIGDAIDKNRAYKRSKIAYRYAAEIGKLQDHKKAFKDRLTKNLGFRTHR